MTEPLLLSRATLRRDVSASALRALLVPDDASARAGAGHRLVWSLFADRPDRERDFLWREAEAGQYYFLSRRAPVDNHQLFHLEDAKPFEPVLAAGDRLRFSLRANATVARKLNPGSKRGTVCDVVMNALYSIPRGERAGQRHPAVAAAGAAWLDGVGSRCGFGVVWEQAEEQEGKGEGERKRRALEIAHRMLRIDHSGPKATLGILDFEGMLEVREPDLFLASLEKGFGRGKAFGCGLMLIRRAASG